MENLHPAQAKLSQSQGEVESASSRCQELEDSIQSLQGTLKRNEQERTQEITNTVRDNHAMGWTHPTSPSSLR